MSISRAETKATGLQTVVVAGQGGYGEDADGGLGGGTERGGGGDGRDGDDNILSWWENNVASLTLGMEPNDPLAYAPGLELHHPIISTLGDTGGRLERERDR